MHAPDRSTPPVIQPIDQIRLQPPTLQYLPNQIPFYIFPNEQLDLIHLLIRVKAGTLYERQKHLALFTYSLLKESSPRHSANEIAGLLDFHGTYYTVSQTLEWVNISVSVPKYKMAGILPLIFEFLSTPEYRDENLSLYRNIRIKDLEYNEQKTEFRATQLLLHAMFGDAVTAGQISTKELLSAITADQMKAYHQETFVAENITIFATGNLDDGLRQLLGDLFSRIPSGKAVPSFGPIALPTDRAPLILGTIPTAVQASINLGMPNIGYLDSDKRDFSILSTLLGGYFGSRLMQRLREKEGYTYGVSSGSVYFGSQSLFIIDSNVNAPDAEAAIQACFEEMQRMQDEPMPASELDAARNYIIGDMLRDVENSVSYMKKYAFWQSFGLSEEEFPTMMRHIREITPDRIQTLAKKYLSYNNFTQVIVK